jgi:hypothetical protein
MLAKAKAAVEDILASDQLQDVEHLTNFARWSFSQSVGYKALPYHNGYPAVHGVWKQVLNLIKYMQSKDIVLPKQPYEPEAFGALDLCPVPLQSLCCYCSHELKSNKRIVCPEQHMMHNGCYNRARENNAKLCVQCFSKLYELEPETDVLEDNSSQAFNIAKLISVEAPKSNAALRTLLTILATGAASVLVEQTSEEYFLDLIAKFSLA